MYKKAIKQAPNHLLAPVENLRRKLKSDISQIQVTDQKNERSITKSIKIVARTSASTPKFSSFLRLLIQHLGVVSVLETGTSLGLNTLYLAESNSQVATIEGCPSIAKLAKDNFDQFSRKNPRLAIGKIRDILEQEILINRPDFYFLDADHRSAEVLFCLNLIMKHTPKAKCIVIHDIYWSPDMRKLWNSIIKDTRFNLTIDLFQAGLIFLNHPIEKQHFTLRF